MVSLVELQNASAIKIKDDEIVDYCKSVGGRFIRVRHKNAVASAVRGFQPGILRVDKFDNRTNVIFEPKVGRNGEVFKDGRLEFTPDKLGILWGEIPDFAYNRKLLSACYVNDTAEWTIVDPADRQAIAELAEKNAQEYGWSKEKYEPPKARTFREIAEVKIPTPVKVEPKQEAVSEKIEMELGVDKPFDLPADKRRRRSSLHEAFGVASNPLKGTNIDNSTTGIANPK